MRRRSFLFAAAAAVFPFRKSFGQTSLGTLTWAQADGLWIRELPDGPSKKIASGAGLSSPRFSPSGKWISYQDGSGMLSVVRADGGNGAHLQGEKSVWLPEGDRVATLRDGDAAVFGSSNGWASPLDRWKDSGLPVASPDGQRFVSVRVHERPKDANGLYQATAELYTASFAAPGNTEVLLSNEGDIAPYGWTRDAKSIVYWRADVWSASLWADGIDLYSIPPSGGSERKLGVSALHHQDLLDFAPESAGNRLAVTNSKGGRQTWSGQQIIVVDPDTGVSRSLTAPDVAALGPVWSPDGRSIACFAAPAGDAEPHACLQQRKIWILDPAGVNHPRQLTSDPKYRDEAPFWSADGSHLLFGRMDYDGHASLWLMESNGVNLRQICPLKVHDELLEKDSWFGFYGYTDWRSAFDWRRI
jgi:Tol biopolymer transport system component